MKMLFVLVKLETLDLHNLLHLVVLLHSTTLSDLRLKLSRNLTI